MIRLARHPRIRANCGSPDPNDKSYSAKIGRDGWQAGMGDAAMTLDELRRALFMIRAHEEAGNWEAVESLSERTYVRLTTEPETPQNYPHEEVIGYLAGFIRRRSDPPFAEQQLGWLRQYLELQP